MKKIVSLVFATLLVTGLISYFGVAAKESVPTVSVYKVSKKTVADTVICTGKVEYEQKKEVRCTSLGVIERIAVKKGDKVNKGDLLFTVVTTSQVSGSSFSEEDVYDAIKSGDYSAISEYASSYKGSAVTQNEDEGELIEITSPINGEVLEINESVGSTVGLSNTVLTVVSGDNLCINVPVNESKISSLQIGQPAQITGNGFKNSTYQGEVFFVDKVAQQVTTTIGKETAVTVKVRVNDPQEDIKQGYSAKCAITTSINEDVIVVPYEAVFYDEEPYVFVYNNGIAQKIEITTGKEYENGVEVTKGLKNDDLVITQPEQVEDNKGIRISECVVDKVD